jgi:hypothetical protein
MGWDPMGGVLGLVQVDHAAAGEATGGLAWISDRVSYAVGDGPVAGEQVTVPAAEFVASAPLAGAHASFALRGTFGSSADGPEMAGCHVQCVDHRGWGESFALSIGFYGCPAAVGTAAEPRLRFQGQADVTEVAVGSTGCRIGFVIDVTPSGQLEVVSYEFEAGAAAVTTGSLLQVNYDARPFVG